MHLLIELLKQSSLSCNNNLHARACLSKLSPRRWLHTSFFTLPTYLFYRHLELSKKKCTYLSTINLDVTTSGIGLSSSIEDGTSFLYRLLIIRKSLFFNNLPNIWQIYFTQKYVLCHVEFPSKFSDKMVNKNTFWKWLTCKLLHSRLRTQFCTTIA